jgi:hypothetical protein
MKRLPALVLSGLALLAASTGAILLGNTVFVVGGEYTFRPGQVVEGNLVAVFARVTLEPGSTVNGKLTGISSDLDLRGSVAGDIASIESEVTLGASCATGGAQREFDLFNFVILFPEIMRLGIASAG